MLNNLSLQGASAVASPGGANNTGNGAAGTTDFLDLVNGALQNVSAAQSTAAGAEANYVAAVPGATIGKALVASDRAQVAWSATVAVRNEVVSAYQSIMNMQF
jgi:flagellar hook-basal body complex protein FliE